MHRIVVDAEADRTYVISAGRNHQVLSASAGRVVGDLLSGDPVRSADTAARFPAAVAAVRAAGWDRSTTVVRHVGHGPHLRRVQIEVALTCNLRCSYCYSTSGPGRKERLTPDEVLGAVAEADAMGVVAIDFTGGEFLMDPDWDSYVTAARATGMATSIHTNGTLITPKVAARLAELEVSRVQISLDSHLAEVHDESRGARNALKRTLRGLDLLHSHGISTRIAIMAHKDNLSTLAQSIGVLRDRYPQAMINVDRIVATGGALQIGNGLTSEEFYTFLRPFMSSTVRAGRVCESATEVPFEPECGVAYSYVYITAQGEVASCPTMTSRDMAEMTGPDLRSVGLAAAWYDSDFFNGFRGTNCENVGSCPAGSGCGGGCRSNAYVESGRLDAPDLFACNANKNPGGAFIDFTQLYSRLAQPAPTAS